MTAPTRLHLVDGSGFIFRAFHSLPPMTRPDGTPVNAVFGFANMLSRLIVDAAREPVAVVFDVSRVTFRNEIYPAYKAHRPDPPPELIPQFPLMRDCVRAFGLASVEVAGFEADDLIASYCAAARRDGLEALIISSDKDLMQLLEPGVFMRDPLKEKMIGPEEVREKFGVGPDLVADVQALCGDPVDNVPGIRGIGPKTAAELINAYGSLDTLLARAHEIRQPKRRQSVMEGADAARISRRLVELRRDVPLPMSVAQLTEHTLDPVALRAFLTENNFRALTSRLERDGWFSDAGPSLPTRSSATTAPTDTAAAAAAPNAGDKPSAISQDYHLIQDEAALAAWIAEATALGVVAVDTETTGLDAMAAGLVGVSLATAPGRACYIPLAHVATDGGDGLALAAPPQQIPLERAAALLKPLLEDPAVLKIAHNVKYDRQIFASLGIDLAPYDDSMLLSFVLDGAQHGHGLDELAQLHFDYETIPYEAVAGSGKNHIGFARVALDKALTYAAEDADICLRLWRLLKPRLVADRMTSLYETIERPMPRLCAAMEREGVKVDRAALNRLSADFAERLARLESVAAEQAGGAFNLGSPKQLGEVLFERLGHKGGKKTKTGAYATGSEVLEPLAEQGVALARTVLDWRQLAKLKSTYADALAQQINPATGRVHTSFMLTGAATGRLSSTDPNLQNIPIRTEEGRKIRESFVAEPGCRLISVDYSQIELRVLAVLADIDALKNAFANGVDIHAATAAAVFGVPLDQVDKETRRRAKSINFGVIYGISAYGLAANIGCSQGEARAFIEAYFKRYPGIRDYMETTKAFARDKGYVETLFGRKCWMVGIKDKNAARRAFAERQAINARIQGTAADIMKRAMVRVAASLAAAPELSARLLLQVHDELLLEAPADQAAAVAQRVAAAMEAAATLDVPLVAESGIGENWATAH